MHKIGIMDDAAHKRMLRRLHGNRRLNVLYKTAAALRKVGALDPATVAAIKAAQRGKSSARK